MTELHITVPMPPSFANASGRSRHWRTVAREKRRYLNLLDGLWLSKQIPEAPAVPLGKVQITATMYVGGQHDQDNLVSRCKWPIDWIATRGFVKNDRHVEWHSFPRQVVKRGQEYRIEFVLREIL